MSVQGSSRLPALAPWQHSFNKRQHELAAAGCCWMLGVYSTALTWPWWGLRWWWHAFLYGRCLPADLPAASKMAHAHAGNAAETAPASIIILMELRLTTMAFSLMNMAVGYGVGICRQAAAGLEGGGPSAHPQSTIMWNTTVRAAELLGTCLWIQDAQVSPWDTKVCNY